MKVLVKSVIAAGCALAFSLGAASAEMKSAVTADELTSILGEAGLPVAVIEDVDTKTPVASVQAGAVQYWIRALDCAGSPKACSTLVFFANFDLGRDATQKDFEIINHYNESQVFGRAYVIPGRNQVGVDYVIELEGGVSSDNIAGNISRWARVIDAFIASFRQGHDIS